MMGLVKYLNFFDEFKKREIKSFEKENEELRSVFGHFSRSGSLPIFWIWYRI